MKGADAYRRKAVSHVAKRTRAPAASVAAPRTDAIQGAARKFQCACTTTKPRDPCVNNLLLRDESDATIKKMYASQSDKMTRGTCSAAWRRPSAILVGNRRPGSGPHG